MPAPVTKRQELDPATLQLDLDNPRLAQNDMTGRPTERDVIEFLAARADLAELIHSIAANGYLDFEPLIVLVESKGRLVVIEGNRRVAAIKLLLNPDLSRELGQPAPELSKPVRASLKKGDRDPRERPRARTAKLAAAYPRGAHADPCAFRDQLAFELRDTSEHGDDKPVGCSARLDRITTARPRPGPAKGAETARAALVFDA